MAFMYQQVRKKFMYFERPGYACCYWTWMIIHFYFFLYISIKNLKSNRYQLRNLTLVT